MIVSLTLAAVLSQKAIDPPNDLGFWIGKWKVFAKGKLDGTDVVEKIVNGFGVVESWTDADGSTGKSLFYYMPETKRWKQIWLTEVGVYKEKYSEPFLKGIRFSGRTFLPNGKELKDRTTLTRLPNGHVHQLIETSQDGKHWTASYEADYEPDQ